MLALGIVLRIVQYLYNRSFWQDEIALATNIIGRDFSELSLPLGHNQAAPYLLLILFKTAHVLFGSNDYGFRLIPLLFSLAGLLIFSRLAPRLLGAAGSVAAMLLLALSPTAINFSVEFKQYPVDVFATIWILHAVTLLLSGNKGRAKWIYAAIAGGVCVWLSFSAVFVLAGAGGVLLINWLARRGNRSELVHCLGLIFVWGVLFAAHYKLVAGAAAGNNELQTFWAAQMLPFPPHSWSDLIQPVIKLEHICDYALPYKLPIIALLLTVSGLYLVWRRSFGYSLALILPIGAVMAASAAGLYPLYSRLILFLLPIVCLASGATLGALWKVGGHRTKPVQILGPILTVLLVVPIAWSATRDTLNPPEKQAIRSVARLLQEVRQANQPVLVRQLEANTLLFYAEQFNIPPETLVVRKPLPNDPSEILSTLYPVDGQTLVWVFILQRFGQPNKAQFGIEQFVEPTGRIKGHMSLTMCDLYLIDLSTPPAPMQ